ncbi:class I SAM-dependent methyltransferase [Streptomyces sp. NPDC002779]|uniref:class I SAM-dependent methyltransferase n=1 Tax=Streptomyces sp. NPDC002779 TaxID=3364664 RepID=UPI003691DAC6
MAALGPVLVEACAVKDGDRVLDVAAGSGNATIPAALAGGDLVASDLTPELLAVRRQEAEARGATLNWQEADAEALPFEDTSFDTVMSCVGVMFAPQGRHLRHPIADRLPDDLNAPRLPGDGRFSPLMICVTASCWHAAPVRSTGG